ncbi:MMPL family transporter [Curtobacterium flaccumfaciens]|uniref:MMPL family transporter n=1 Tax=Curtobacterium flaccumfaciens TaxID=2035 RepID=UPI001E44D1EB|nr:MMPL family transporter [Curtobacterium allii]MCE0459742.1 MMPL family transporter [Curtobacterium allii]
MARLLSRLGQFSARHRAVFLIGWLLAIVVLAVVALSGMRFSDGGFDVPGTESSQALKTLDKEFPGSDAQPRSLQLVVQAPKGDRITEPAATADLQDALGVLRKTAHVSSVSNPFDPQQPYVSKDKSTAVATVMLHDVSDDNSDRVHDDVIHVAKDLREQGYTAEVGGTIANPIPEIFGPSEVVGAVLAFVVLFITFGSLVAAGANMAGALVGVGVGILGILAFSIARPIGSTTPILAVMLGLAVGIDYCLFVIARFRSELRAGRSEMDAIGRSIGTAGSSVVFAAATVIIALAGLAVVGIPFISEMGFAAAFAVFIAVLMTLTFLPVLLRTMGRRVLPRKEREGQAFATEEPARMRFLDKWVQIVTRRPAIVIPAAVLVLAIVAAPVLSLRTTLDIPGGEDPKSTQRAAYDLISEEFGAGVQNPLVVLVERTAGTLDDHVAAVQHSLERQKDVATVVPGASSQDGDWAMLTVLAKSGPLSDRTTQLIQDIRADSDVVPGARVSVTGATAIGLDSNAKLQAALGTYLVVVVGLSLVLLILMFRSILVPIVATIGYLLSLGAGMGATIAVFQWGWFGPLISAPQGNPLLSLLPIILAGILFGLAMDYQVFLVSRIHEAHHRGLSPREAILDGFGRSAPVVVAAAAIMAAVFGGFALSKSSLVGSIALGLAVGVIADAFIVRMIVVPAALALLGKSAWWIPKWLDRILPELDTEGLALDQDDAPNSAPTRSPAATRV